MSLRNRLFLWVSGLFIVIVTISSILENRATAHRLKEAKQELRQEILELSEKRRQHLEEFVAESMAENMVKVDAILSNILQYAPIALRFSPLSINEKRGTWGESADLLLEYKWIDFLQNTAENHVIALLSPQEGGVQTSYQSPIDKELSWVYLENNPSPFLGIRVPYFLTTDLKEGNEQLERISGEIPMVLFTFDPEQMRTVAAPQMTEKTWPPLLVKWTEGYELSVDLFAKAFARAQEQLRSGQLRPPVLGPEELEQKIKEGRYERPPLLSPAFLSSLPQEELMKKRLEEVATSYTQMNLLWIWMALFETGVFGKTLFEFPAPTAVGIWSQNHPVGFGIPADGVLFANPLFSDAQYYQGHALQPSGSGLANGIAVIPSGERLFLGNTAQFSVDARTQEKRGYLTLGTDADGLVERLVLALGQTVVLVHNNTVFGAYDAHGQPLGPHTNLPLETMQQNHSGIVSWEGSRYFYMHLQPFAELDLHLLLLNPEEKEFALLRDLEQGSQEVVSGILFNIRVTGLIALCIAIVILHNIARKITQPIAQLATITGHVAEGHLDQISLKKFPFKHHDEIAALYSAFEKMIVGLKEKEKVKGVLNKVVSSEIAQEILQGSVHLGGEEKRVSVLFADIRGFTNMTQHLPASEVIGLLNFCMTRLSRIVDLHQGVIDKYVGDEVMALFGAPITRGQDTLHAVQSAVEMMAVMREWNQERSSKSQFPVEIGIGVHTGVMLAGNMGAENRLNYTVIGRNVNLAARLCSAAKPGEILVSADTLQEIEPYVLYETMTPLTLKGFDEAVPVYRITGIKGPA